MTLNKEGRSTLSFTFSSHSPWTQGNQRLFSATFGVDSGNALGGSDVPDADGLVSGRGDKQVGVGWMPAELVYTVAVTSVVVLLHLPPPGKKEDECRLHIILSRAIFRKETVTPGGDVSDCPLKQCDDVYSVYTI